MKCSPIAHPANGAIHLSEAGSAAETTTMVVYSSAPYFSSVCATAATVEFYCPIAT
jgi:hypothetical protein